MNPAWIQYQLTYIERDIGLTGAAAEALLAARYRAARYVQQFTRARTVSGAKDVLWEDFK